MKVNALYFAALRERVGTPQETLELPADVDTVGALRQWIARRGEPWASAFAETGRVRAAVDQAMATEQSSLHDGAEVAFFPPVTGG
jgi:sulfur-carrier protein